MAAEGHYDQKAVSASPARSRLQKFHNKVKKDLLAQFAQGASRLLDVASGRGGDVHKWSALGIREVLGLDVSLKSVEEARRRTLAAGCAHQYGFQQADLRRGWSDGTVYDAVSCMFALHYFFESEEAAHTLMRTVAAHLAPGGVFLGIVPDGQRVNDCIKGGPEYDNGVMTVRAAWEGPPRCFGSPYTFGIRGTVTEGSKVPEFLVYDNVVATVARMHGLRPVPVDGPCFRKNGEVFYQQVPPYTGPEAEASLIFAAFALKKD